jgi:hypothetical protein
MLESKYKIIPEENLVIEFHTGILDLGSYMNFKKKVIRDSVFKQNLNHFIHFKNVVFKTSPSDISFFAAFIKANLQSYGNRKIAFITKTPNQVVSTTMYKILQNNSTQTCEIFSTNENALKWLNPPTLTIEELNKILDNFI